MSDNRKILIDMYTNGTFENTDKEELIYGKPGPCPEAKDHNMFKCWKCHGMLPWMGFPHKSYHDHIARRENGYFQCCNACRDKHSLKFIVF